MPRWLRIIRGMIGTGLTFAAGVGIVGLLIGGVMWLIPGALTGRELIEIVAKCAVIAFPVGAAFSGVLALAARGRSFEKLSLPLFASLGAAAGFLLFMALGLNGAFGAWSVSDAIANLVILTLIGGASATVTLLVARKARPALKAGDEPDRLGDG